MTDRSSAVAATTTISSWLPVFLILMLAPGAVPAQVQRPAQRDESTQAFDPEVRVDAIVARVSAIQAAVGATLVTGSYLRAGAVAGVGYGNDGLSGRIDGFTRFHFDPFRQSRWGPYGGGGISGRFDRGNNPRAFLLLLAGLDGPVSRGMTPSIELGLGGGARIGLVLRRAAAGRR